MINNKELKFIDLSKFSPKLIFTKSGNKTYPLNIAYAGEKIIISRRNHRHRGEPKEEFIVIPKNQICLWYKWPAGRNQFNKENKGCRFKHLLLPRYIKLDKLTFNALGALQAEMNKHTKRASNIIFTNSEPVLINVVLEFFERLFIEKENWSWSVIFNFKLKNNESKIETQARETEALAFWTTNSLINPNKIQNKCLQYTGNKKYENMRPGSMRYGSLRMLFPSIIHYQLILNFLERINELIAKDEGFITYYMQGLIAGEGYVKPTKYKSLDSVRIGCTKESEKQYYHALLSRLNINSSIEENQISISNQKNFLIMYQLELIKLHPKKYITFLNALLGFKQISLRIKEDFLRERENIKKELYILNKKRGELNEKGNVV
jgi:hypothetical protein